jgi:ParB family transcriptional regulator, chromosome partitioning protein
LQEKLSSRQTRQLVKSLRNKEATSETMNEDYALYHDKIRDLDIRAQRSFDKSITALRVAMSKLASVIETVEDN